MNPKGICSRCLSILGLDSIQVTSHLVQTTGIIYPESVTPTKGVHLLTVSCLLATPMYSRYSCEHRGLWLPVPRDGGHRVWICLWYSGRLMLERSWIWQALNRRYDNICWLRVEDRHWEWILGPVHPTTRRTSTAKSWTHSQTTLEDGWREAIPWMVTLIAENLWRIIEIWRRREKGRRSSHPWVIRSRKALADDSTIDQSKSLLQWVGW